MDNSSGILRYMHCRNCVERALREGGRGVGPYAVGFAAPSIIRVWCEGCDQLIANLTLAAPIPLPSCEVCDDEEGGPNHH